MILVEVALFFACVVCVVSVLWLPSFVLRNGRQDRLNEVGGLEDLDGLRWNGWTLVRGWPPVTCWQGCADLHRANWWTAYLDKAEVAQQVPAVQSDKFPAD